MVDISLPNFITVGLMAALFTAVFTAIMGYFGLSTTWLA